jgi:hypothetical protein
MLMRPVFDDWLAGSVAGAATQMETSARYSRWLASADAVVLQALVPVGAAAPTYLQIYMDQSTDGLRWQSKYTSMGGDTPLLSASSFALHRLNSFSGGEAYPGPPTLKHVRLRILYDGPAARIVVSQINRMVRMRVRRNKQPCCAPCASGAADVGRPALSHQVAASIRRLAQRSPSPALVAHLARASHPSVRGLPPELRWSFVRSTAPPDLRAELDEHHAAARALPTSARAAFSAAADSAFWQFASGSEEE